MASQTGKFREDQVLIICPGSQTTMAQLGCAELTPPALRLPTRMFHDEETDEWRPYFTYRRRKAILLTNGNGDGPDHDDDDYEFVEDPDSDEGAVYPVQGGRIVVMDAFLAFLDHVHSLLTKSFHNTPIMLMASPQWTRPDCETIARYIFEKTKTPALCLIHSGIATQYGLKWPNMTVVDVGFEKVDVTCIYDNRIVNHNVLGYPGPDRAISGGEVFTQRLHRLLESQGFTYEMADQLKKSNICEVLPYVPDSPNLMDLPVDSSNPGASISAGVTAGPRIAFEIDDGTNGGEKSIDEDGVLDVANIVTSGQTREFLAKKEKEKAEKQKSRKGGRDKDTDGASKPLRLPNAKKPHNIFHYEEVVMEEPATPSEDNDNGGDYEMTDDPQEPQEQEERQERQERQEPPEPPVVVKPAPAKPTEEGTTRATTSDAPKTEPGTTGPGATAGVTLTAVPKSEQMDHEPAAPEAPAPEAAAPEAAAPEAGAPEDALEDAAETGAQETGTPEPDDAEQDDQEEGDDDAGPDAGANAMQESTVPEQRLAKRVRRDVEVGLERFLFADRNEIDRIVTTIYRTVQGIDDMYMRPQCWENIVFVGNGSRLRGLKDNIMQTLTARHLVSPSTATMFTSELPSNLATPSGTGSQTPTGSFTGVPHQLPTSSSVNPLLQAATTASLVVPGGIPGGAAMAVAGSNIGEAAPTSHHFHSQTPTAIKLAPLPNYLSEWSKNGFEEAMFLGSQVAARLAFCVHNLDVQGVESQRLMSLSRIDYNDFGPKGIRTHSMLD